MDQKIAALEAEGAKKNREQIEALIQERLVHVDKLKQQFDKQVGCDPPSYVSPGLYSPDLNVIFLGVHLCDRDDLGLTMATSVTRPSCWTSHPDSPKPPSIRQRSRRPPPPATTRPARDTPSCWLRLSCGMKIAPGCECM